MARKVRHTPIIVGGKHEFNNITEFTTTDTQIMSNCRKKNEDSPDFTYSLQTWKVEHDTPRYSRPVYLPN